MSTNSTINPEDQEIDLTMISKKMGNAFQRLNSFLFRCIQFVIKNIIILIVLLVVGVGIGIYLDKTQKTYDHQIIVSPNFGSVDYLYSKVELIQSKIKEKDTVFLKNIGIQDPEKLVKIEISPIIDLYRFVTNNELNFALLKLLAEDGDIKKIVSERTTSKNYPYHAISFTTKRLTSTQKTVKPLLSFLNDSDFFRKVQKEYVNNIMVKMKSNDETIAQIDGFLNEFSNTASGSGSKSDKLVYYNENTQLNDVIKTKDELVKEQGNHRIDLVTLDQIIKENSATTNIENNTSVNGKLKFVLPILFISIFLAIHFFRAFYRKQSLKAKQQTV